MKRLILILITLMAVVSPLLADDNHYTPADVGKYQNNGNITAVVLNENGQRMTNVEVAVFNGTECRSTNRASADGLVYITTYGDSKFNIVFHVYDHSTRQEQIIDQKFQYVANMTVGSYDEPYEILWTTSALVGDVNNDSKVDIIDLCCLLAYLKDGTTLANIDAADVDGSGIVDIDDVKALSDTVLSNTAK